MIRRVLIFSVVIILVSTSSLYAWALGPVLQAIAKQALESAAGEAGKIAVDKFQDLFNKNKDIAQKKMRPKLLSSHIDDKTRSWTISPMGRLTKSDVQEIARKLKTLDKNRDQAITIRINNRD